MKYWMLLPLINGLSIELKPRYNLRSCTDSLIRHMGLGCFHNMKTLNFSWRCNCIESWLVKASGVSLHPLHMIICFTNLGIIGLQGFPTSLSSFLNTVKLLYSHDLNFLSSSSNHLGVHVHFLPFQGCFLVSLLNYMPYYFLCPEVIIEQSLP